MAKTIQTAIEAGSRMALGPIVRVTILVRQRSLRLYADAEHPRTSLIAMVPIITRTGTRKRRPLISLYWKMPKNI